MLFDNFQEEIDALIRVALISSDACIKTVHIVNYDGVVPDLNGISAKICANTPHVETYCCGHIKKAFGECDDKISLIVIPKDFSWDSVLAGEIQDEGFLKGLLRRYESQHGILDVGGLSGLSRGSISDYISRIQVEIEEDEESKVEWMFQDLLWIDFSSDTEYEGLIDFFIHGFMRLLRSGVPFVLGYQDWFFEEVSQRLRSSKLMDENDRWAELWSLKDFDNVYFDNRKMWRI